LPATRSRIVDDVPPPAYRTVRRPA